MTTPLTIGAKVRLRVTTAVYWWIDHTCPDDGLDSAMLAAGKTGIVCAVENDISEIGVVWLDDEVPWVGYVAAGALVGDIGNGEHTCPDCEWSGHEGDLVQKMSGALCPSCSRVLMPKGGLRVSVAEAKPLTIEALRPLMVEGWEMPEAPEEGWTPVARLDDIAGCMATEFDDEEHEPRGARKTFAEAYDSDEGVQLLITDNRIVFAYSDYGVYADDEDDPTLAEDGDLRVHAVHQVNLAAWMTLLLMELHERGVDVDALLAVEEWEEMEAALSVLGEGQGEE